jgi:hypothetical protein
MTRRERMRIGGVDAHPLSAAGGLRARLQRCVGNP